jgi:hypothetical protein
MEDHLLVGSPGVPTHNGGICSTCGRVIEQVVQKLGSDLSIQVEQAQSEAAEHDTPALARKRMRG